MGVLAPRDSRLRVQGGASCGAAAVVFPVFTNPRCTDVAGRLRDVLENQHGHTTSVFFLTPNRVTPVESHTQKQRARGPGRVLPASLRGINKPEKNFPQ